MILITFYNVVTKMRKKIEKLKAFDLTFLPGKTVFGDDDYQPTLKLLKVDKGIEYVISWKSKGLHNYKLVPLYTALLHNIKFPGYKTGIQFNWK